MWQQMASDRLAPGEGPPFPHPGVRRFFGAVQIMHIIMFVIFRIFFKKKPVNTLYIISL